MSSFQWPPNAGGTNGITTYASFAALPSGLPDGSQGVTLDTDTVYVYNAGSSTWLAVGSPGAALSVGAVGAVPNNNAAVISANVLSLEPADGTHPGVLTSGAQTIGGNKTFSGTIGASNFSGTSSGTNTGDQTITLTSDVTGSGSGSFATTISAGVVTLAKQANLAANSIIGNNTGSPATPLALTVAQVNTLTGNSGDITITAVGAAPSANGASLSGQALTLQPADGTHPGLLTSGAQTIGGAKTFSSTIGATNFSGTSSGTNTGDQTITLTSDVTGSGAGSFATTIANSVVTNPKMANMASSSSTVGTVKGNISGSAAAPSDIVLTSANTASSVVYRDGSNNFSAGTITAALTGTASGNTTYSANNHGVVLSSATNTMTVLAPNASTAFPLVSGGSSADPSYALLTVPGGGTGLASAIAYAVLCGGTTSTGAHQSIASVGTATQVLTSNGPGALPTFQTSPNAPRAQLILDSGNGHGSTNTKVRRWTNTQLATSSGVDWSYADSATNGGIVTILTAGLWAIGYNDRDSVNGAVVAIVINGTALTTSATGLTYAQGLRALADIPTLTGGMGFCSWTGILAVNDLVYFMDNGTNNSTSAQSMAFVTKVNN